MQLERILHGFGWSRNDPGIQLMYRSPVDLHLDEWVHDLLATLHRTGATRVAIDSLGDLRAACRDELRFREYVYSLLQRCARDSISVCMSAMATTVAPRVRPVPSSASSPKTSPGPRTTRVLSSPYSVSTRTAT